jgi:outer membrane protein
MPQKKLVALWLCLAFLLFSTQPVLAADAVKIATMNLQKVLAVSKTGGKVKASVTKKYDDYQEKFRRQEEVLVGLKEEIDKKSAVWSADIKTKKEREFKRLVQDFEEESRDASNDMKEFERQQVEPILKELEEIIDVYGKAKGYSLILDTSKGVLYQDESLDISGDLAVELDKRHPDDSK